MTDDKQQTKQPKSKAAGRRASIALERQDVLSLAMELAQAQTVPGPRSGRQRAAELRSRMSGFRRIYNAGWMVRYTQHTTASSRKKAIADFCQVLLAELSATKDQEALIYAVADTLTCSPHGLPWES